MTRVDVENGKYSVIIDGGGLYALHYGKYWRDLTGNKMIYCLAAELQEAREQRDAAEAKLRGAGDVRRAAHRMKEYWDRTYGDKLPIKLNVCEELLKIALIDKPAPNDAAAKENGNG